MLERVKSGRIRLFFVIGFFMLVAHRLSAFSKQIFSFEILARYTLRPSYIFILIAAVLSYNYVKDRIYFRYGFVSFWIISMIAATILLTIRGIYNDYIYDTIISDLEVMFFFMGGIFIGMRRENWKFIINFYIILLVIGSIVNVIALAMLPGLARDQVYNSLAYDVQYLIWPAMFLIMLVFNDIPKKNRIILISVFILNIIEQLVFQKRFPTVKLVAITALMFFILPFRDMKKSKSAALITQAAVFGVIAIGIVGLLLTYNIEIGTSFGYLGNRFTGTSGSVVTTSIEDNRFQMIGIVIDNIRGNEVLIGKGMGSWILDPGLWWNVDYTSIYDKDFHGVTGIEVGQVWPYWKGGILFFILINSIFVFLISKYRFYKADKFLLFCWTTVLFHFFSLFGEAWVGTHQLNLLLYGLCMGQIMVIYKSDTETSKVFDDLDIAEEE